MASDNEGVDSVFHGVATPTALPRTHQSGSSSGASSHGVRWVFYGVDGLRAGWSLLLYVAVAWALVACANPLLHRVLPSTPQGAATPLYVVLAGDGTGFGALALAALLVSAVEKRSFSQYGLGRLRPGQFLWGTLLGTGLLSMLVLLLKLGGLLVFDGVLLHGTDAWTWGVAWFGGFLAVGLAEEFAMRGFLQFTLSRGLAGAAAATGLAPRTRQVIGFWTTALLFSVVFGLGHTSNAGESPIGLLSAGLIGLAFAFSLWRTGSLWWAVGFHAAWDWAESFVYGVADSGNMVAHHLAGSHPQGRPLWSGGLTGPEGSLWVLPIVVLTALVVRWTLPSEPDSPSDAAYQPEA